jgi:hypothetical protein
VGANPVANGKNLAIGAFRGRPKWQVSAIPGGAGNRRY